MELLKARNSFCYRYEKNIWEVCELSLYESLEFFKQLTITDRQKVIVVRIVKEIVARLQSW